jgi:hypothetical protein
VARLADANHATASGIWLVFWKKGTGRPYPSRANITQEALRLGWVDSRPRSVDADRTAILVTPRRPTSKWSRINKERVARLTVSGAMAPAGLRAVGIAKSNGAWTALDATEDLVEPPDLAAALDAQPAARAFWDEFRGRPVMRSSSGSPRQPLAPANGKHLSPLWAPAPHAPPRSTTSGPVTARIPRGAAGSHPDQREPSGPGRAESPAFGRAGPKQPPMPRRFRRGIAVEDSGIEPLTSALQRRRSPS